MKSKIFDFGTSEKFKEEIMPILSNTNQNKVPELPVKGNLDIQKVKESEYFFC